MQWLNWLCGICWKDCQAWTKHEKWTCCTVFCFKQPITFTCSLSARMPFCSTLLYFAIWWKLIFDNVRILQYVFCTCIFVTTCPCLGRHQLWQYAHTFLQWCACVSSHADTETGQTAFCCSFRWEQSVFQHVDTFAGRNSGYNHSVWARRLTAQSRVS